MKTLARVLGIGSIALLLFAPGLANAAPRDAHGVHGAPARPAFHGAPRDGDHHREFHRDGRGHVFVGVAPFWNPWPVYVAPLPDDPPPAAYWYYCPSANAYYPYVATCPVPWVPVVPSAG